MSNDFWSVLGRGNWPRDPDGHVFLGRAVLRIGQAMFGDQWNDEDCGNRTAPRVHHHPTAPTGDDLMAVRGDAIWLRNKYMAGPPAPHSPVGQPAPPKFSPHMRRASHQLINEWDVLKELSRREASRIAAARKRFEAVQIAIAGAAERKELQTAYRPTVGGLPEPCPVQWWATDRLAPRFTRCEIDPKNPYGPGIGGSTYCHLFVLRDSLMAFLAQQNQSPTTKAGDQLEQEMNVHLSPYLKLMVEVARDMNIDRENQPLKKLIVLRMLDLAPRFGIIDLKDTTAGYLATFVREPESQAGGNRAQNKV